MNYKLISYVALFLFVSVTCCRNKDHNSLKTKSASQIENLKQSNNLEHSYKTNNSNATFGIDISKFEGNEIYTLRNNVDLSIIICKATEGITYTDPDFITNWNQIRKEGYIRGSYHFYRSSDDPIELADNYSKLITDIRRTDIPPIVDFERSGINTSETVENVQKNFILFLERIESNTTRQPIIYTDISIANKYLNKDVFSNYALWIAYYSNANKPKLPFAWSETGWKFWQKSSSYNIDNVENDFDLFNGSKKSLLEFIQNY